MDQGRGVPALSGPAAVAPCQEPPPGKRFVAPRGLPPPFEVLLGVLVALLVLRALFLAYPVLGAFPGRDSAVFLYTGWRVTQGEVPYRDVWDHKPPLIYYIDALGLLVGGRSGWGVWLIEGVALLGAAGLGYALMRRMYGPLIAAVTSVAWVAKLPALLFDGNLTEEYALPLQWLALWLFYHAEKRGRYAWEGYAIGLTGALAFLLRQNLVSVWLAIGAYLLLRAAWRGSWRGLAPLVAAIAAASGVLAVVGGYFAAQGALAALCDAAFKANFAYGRTTPGALGDAALAGLLLLLGLALPAVIGWLRALRRVPDGLRGGDARGALLAVSAIAAPVEVVLSGLSARLYPHYYMPWLPICALLAGDALAWLQGCLASLWHGSAGLQPLHRSASRLFCAGAAAAVVAFTLLAQVTPVPPGNPWVRGGPSPYEDVTRYVQQTTDEDDAVLVWGAETAIDFVAGRRSPTRFVYQYALFAMPGYQNPALVEEFLAGIKANEPVLIIDTSPTNRVVPPLDAAARAEWARGQQAPLLPEMEQVFTFLSAHYRCVEMDNRLGWVAYRRAGS